MYKVKEFFGDNVASADAHLNRFVKKNNIRDFKVIGFKAFKTKTINTDQSYILIKYKVENK